MFIIWLRIFSQPTFCIPAIGVFSNLGFLDGRPRPRRTGVCRESDESDSIAGFEIRLDVCDGEWSRFLAAEELKSVGELKLSPPIWLEILLAEFEKVNCWLLDGVLSTLDGFGSVPGSDSIETLRDVRESVFSESL